MQCTAVWIVVAITAGGSLAYNVICWALYLTAPRLLGLDLIPAKLWHSVVDEYWN